MDHLHEPSQVAAAIDELKFALLKLQLLHDAKLSDAQRTLVASCCHGETFAHMIKNVRAQIE